MKTFVLRLLLPVFFVALMASCKQEPMGDQLLELEIESTVAGAPLDSIKTVTLGTTNARVRFTGFQALFSDIRLISEKGDTVKFADTYVLYAGQIAGGPVKKFELGEVPTGKYKGLIMTLGIPVEENTQDGARGKNPIDFPTGHPLNQTIAPTNGTTKMFWSWNSGYIFIKFDGYVDISIGNTGGELTKANAASGGDVRTLAFHVGVNGNQQKLVFNEPFEVKAGGTHLPVEIHVDDIFEQINLKTDFFTHSFGNAVNAPATMTRAELAAKVARASKNAIHLHLH